MFLNCDTQEEKNKLLDYITNLQQENEIIRKMNLHAHKYASDMEGKYLIEKSRYENAQDLILNELSHLKANDEETWNKEFYDENNKLDYRKLCIELLNQVANLLDGGDK